MTDSVLEPPPGPRRDAETTVETLLSRALRRARLSLLWERLWPAIAALATAVGLFLCVSWLGVWLVLPPMGRAIGLFLFLLITAAALVPLLRLRLPTSHDGLRRLDRVSGILHRPATAVADNMATTANDAVSVALWQAHVERAMRAARNLRAGLPMPRLAARDPMALRALVLVLLVATFVAAGGERGKRISAAFDWRGALPVNNFRLDAWVTPPQYTGRPPIILQGLRPGETALASTVISVPAGSMLVVRGSGKGELDVTVRGGVSEAPADSKAAGPAAPAGTEEHRYTIADSGSATIRGVGPAVTWSFTAIPDKPPTIALAKDPEQQQRGSLLLAYKVEDDYGVNEAKAEFTPKTAPVRDGQQARPLFGPPEMPLVLPQSRAKSGVGQTIKDLTDHPWAGTDVAVTLTARDEAGNEGKSAAHEFRLPERVFVKPMARALIEQRRTLALDGHAAPRVLIALDALTLAPDRFGVEAGVYLGMRSVHFALKRARTDEALRDVVGQLWALALAIEDGNLSDAERDLRAAQDALRQALERGASEEEIKKLMDNLRAALDRFMQSLAEQMRRNPQQLARPLDQNTRMLRPQDLRSMLDRLEQMARSGNRDAAQRMLQELQQMLENLQMARPGQQGGDDDMMAQLDELGDMIRKQQQLRDRTFQQGQDQRRQQRGQRGQRGQQGQQGQQGQEGDEGQMGNLRQDQQALRDRLSKLLEQMRKNGMGQPQPGQPGQQGQQGDGTDELGRAGDAMGDAEGQLGEGNADGAVDSQGRALEAMRKGAQGMAQAMQQQMGQGPGPGQPGGRQSRAEQQTDPLGRPMRNQGTNDDTSVRVPGEIDVQRARRILEELRRRFGESFRPQLELDYLERLLRDF